MTRKYLFESCLYIGLLLFILSSCESKVKDTTSPVINDTDFLPADCDIYYQGDTLWVDFTCTDNVELGNFNIEIHNNFDHHTHGTSAVDCDDDHAGEEHHHDDAEDHDHESVEGAWVYNQDFSIPAGQTQYHARIPIVIPEDALEGDYHFMLRLTDHAGWQTIKAVAIEIIEH